MRRVTEKGMKALIQWEGFKNKAYQDAVGLWTIGIGHLITPEELASGEISVAGQAKPWRNGLSNEDVIELKHQDLRKVYKVLERVIPNDITPYQFDALVMFAFNVGNAAFLESTLNKKLQEGLYDEIPKELGKWTKGRVYNKKTGKKELVVIPGLVNRRNAEIELWNTPYE